MTIVRWIAAAVLFLQLPVPLYWFVVHPQIDYWRKHQKAAYAVGLLAWPLVAAGLVILRHEMFLREYPAAWRMAAGFTLIILEIYLFGRAARFGHGAIHWPNGIVRRRRSGVTGNLRADAEPALFRIFSGDRRRLPTGRKRTDVASSGGMDGFDASGHRIRGARDAKSIRCRLHGILRTSATIFQFAEDDVTAGSGW